MKAEEDPIVSEIPVFLSNPCKSAQNQASQNSQNGISESSTIYQKNELYLMQFPLETASHPLNKANRDRHIKAAFKSSSSLFQFSVPLNPASQHYSKFKGQECAVGERSVRESLAAPTLSSQSGKNKSELHSGDDNLHHTFLDNIIYQGEKVSDCSGVSGNLMVGVVRDGALHLTPLNGVIQFRPALFFLDGIDKHVKTNARSAGDGSSSEESASEIEDPANAAAASSSSTKKDAASQPRKALQKKQDIVDAVSKSHKRILTKKLIEDEPWSSLGYYDEYHFNQSALYGFLCSTATSTNLASQSSTESYWQETSR